MPFKRFWLCLIFLILLLPCSKVKAEELVIKTDKIQQLKQEYPIKVLDYIEKANIYKVEVPEKKQLQRMKTNQKIKYLAVNKKVSIAASPSLPKETQWFQFNQSWGAQSMNFSYPLIGNHKVKIALLDTGVELDNSSIMKHLLPGENLIDPEQPPDDDQGHGTHIAGILSMNLPESVQIIPIKIMDSHGEGDVFTVAKGIYLAIEKGADVMNISLGTDSDIPIIREAIQKGLDKGITIIAASGNYGGSSIDYPARYKGVISVGAYDQGEKRAYFSQYGKDLDFVAPGTSIESTYLDNTFQSLDGTSMATAFITRAAAIVKTIQPNLMYTGVFSLLKQASVPLGKSTFSEETGYGKVDLKNLYYFTVLYHVKSTPKTAVSKRKVWQVDLKQTVDPASVNHKTLFIVDKQNHVIDTKISLNKNGKGISIAPLKPYQSGESYFLYCTNFIHGLNHNQNLKSTSIVFTIN